MTERGQHRPPSQARGAVLISRAWPARALVYAELREARVDVYGVEAVADLEEALRTWPARFGAVLLDAAGFSEGEVAEAAAAARVAKIPVLLLAGAWGPEAAGAGEAGVRVVRRPVSVGEVVEALCSLLAGGGAGAERTIGLPRQPVAGSRAARSPAGPGGARATDAPWRAEAGSASPCSYSRAAGRR